MNCPTCPASTLIMTDRSGVEIDYCPTCRGVWLDRGELDKIIERDASLAVRQPDRVNEDRVVRDDRNSNNRGRRYSADQDRGRYDDDWDDDRRFTDDGRKRRKRESVLSELFDF